MRARPNSGHGRARFAAATLLVLAATQVGGCLCSERKAGEPTEAQTTLVNKNLEAGWAALRGPKPDCARARLAVTIAATENRSWTKPYFDRAEARIEDLRADVLRRCRPVGSTTATTPAAPSPSSGPAPSGTRTQTAPARTPTSTSEAPAATSEAPPAATPTVEEPVPGDSVVVPEGEPSG